MLSAFDSFDFCFCCLLLQAIATINSAHTNNNFFIFFPVLSFWLILGAKIVIKNESTKLLADYFTYQYYKHKVAFMFQEKDSWKQRHNVILKITYWLYVYYRWWHYMILQYITSYLQSFTLFKYQKHLVSCGETLCFSVWNTLFLPRKLLLQILRTSITTTNMTLAWRYMKVNVII